MRTTSNIYPEWVIKYKSKGTYINFVKPDKYYLYAAHSERIPGTDKVRRVCDGYLGRITENEGLIPAKKRNTPVDNNVYLLEFGLSSIIVSATIGIRKGLNRTYRENGDWIYCMGILSYMFDGIYSEDLFRSSYLSSAFNGTNQPLRITKSISSGIERSTRMIKETMVKTYGDSLTEIEAYARTVGIIRYGGSTEITYITPYAAELFRKHGIVMEAGEYGKNR